MRKQGFDILGMTCSACSARVEKSVSSLSGVEGVSVNLLKNTMTLSYNEELISTSDIINAVKKAGYGASLKGEGSKAEVRDTARDQLSSLKKRLIISAIFEIPLFYLAMGGMLGLPLPPFFLGEENALIFAFTQFLLLLPILIAASKYFTGGVKALLHRSPNMDSLITIGAGSAVVYGIYAIYKIGFGLGHGDGETVHHFMMNLYFESAGMILTLITLGKTLEARAKRRTSDAITGLMKLAPAIATVERDGVEEVISAEDIRIGDVLIVKSGESIPVDGVILEGSASVDESALTGESIPSEKATGDSVIGATVSRSGYFRMRAERVGEDTALAQIIRLVDDASASKAPIAKFADKISRIFVPAVISIAILSAAAWLIATRDIELALSIGISVLVISCPCSLGLATPTAIMVGMGKGASNGILIKSAEALQEAHTVSAVVLDKTGTVTEGQPKVTDIFPAEGVDRDFLLTAAASIEKLSEHPLATAVVNAAKEEELKLIPAQELQQISGGGIAGIIDGGQVLGGNRRLMEQNGLQSPELFALGDSLAESAKTPLYFAYNGKPLGIIALADTVKPSSRSAVSELKAMGLDVIMLTGDNKKTAHAIARQVGIDNVVSEVLPADKEKHIRELSEGGKRVAMVGDGINDAPALARAEVGIAIGAGTDIAIESADIVLMRSDLSDVPRAIRLSRAVMRNIKQNLFWAFFYNIIGIPVAAGLLYIPFGIRLDPMIAGAAMSLSSLFVVSNALRLRTVRLSGSKRSSSPEALDCGAVVLTVKGMSCEHCVARVKKALSEIDGVESVDVELSSGKCRIALSREVPSQTLVAAIENAGYRVKNK